MKVGDKYNWIGQPERLIFLGRNWSGNGYWNQFAKVDSPEVVWCEVYDYDLDKFEKTVIVGCVDANITEKVATSLRESLYDFDAEPSQSCYEPLERKAQWKREVAGSRFNAKTARMVSKFR